MMAIYHGVNFPAHSRDLVNVFCHCKSSEVHIGDGVKLIFRYWQISIDTKFFLMMGKDRACH